MCADEMPPAPEKARGMSTTPPTRPQRAPSAPDSGTRAPGSARPAAPEPSTFAEMLDDITPVVGVIAVAGPPVIFVAGPWLLFGLLLSGPFALAVALAVVAMLLVALAAAIVGILVAPYLLARYVRARRAERAEQAVAVAGAPAAPLVSVGSARVAA